MNRTPTPARVAVVGSGVAGLVAAHVASRTAHVTLFEADARLGGHADTHRVGDLAIDTGFIVHNERTYPVLLRLFAELGVRTQDSEMSMSVSDRATGVEYAGALGPRGLFPTARALARRAYLRMLVDVPRFHRAARALLDDGPFTRDPEETLRAFLDRGRFNHYFRRHFMEPLVAAVWSCDPELALDYPARYLFAFLRHHGMLGVFGSPQWRTVTGGSHEYVHRVAEGLHEIRLGTKVTSVLETAHGVEVTDGNGDTATYDAVVVAAHPDQALAMLAEPTDLQREVLGALPYSANTAQLHTDTSLLPRAGRAWASWNFLRPQTATGRVTVTYDLTRLQRLATDTRYLVTLGGTDLVDPDEVIATMEYAHPLYTPESVAAQRRLPEIDTARIVFAGAYHGWGFHEDGARSGLAAAEHLGFAWPDRSPAPAQAEPRLVEATVRHTRRQPFRHRFTYRSHPWLVDLDHLPAPRRTASFEARDHLGDPDRTIRENVEAFLATHGIDLGGGRIRMLANARAFGYSFNPISVFWCHDATGALVGTVLEVHNTYGDRHAYLVHTDERGKAGTDKAMYVSPFHDVSGRYEISAPEPDDTVAIAITLRHDDGPAFTASLNGHVVSGRPPLRAIFSALVGSVRIRRQGIGLWLRRLPVVPRPDHPRQEGVQ
ncbi:FAD-dependent oxidoreductase [Nocardioides guangzhouensis]|uniref:FAD-dependent oxidoreductase n=1 Tax=Nocardioides guangzhouensis TaxID=2497878 RepID=A0A4Q4ZGA2_9ACTN|nr:FAD-dependent oxidoreductase [Nocardioides guangzhouensis]RYP87187.1 FAD-dependent oxidoreductase [Nocardioides guangzhouensis]